MYLKRFKTLNDAKRIRKPQPDNITLRLQRNEKVDNWPEDLLEKIYGSMPDNMLQQYPEASPFYNKLSQFLDVGEEKLLVASGIDEPIKSLLLLCCDAGDKIVYTPGYAMYEVYSRMFGVDTVSIEYNPARFTGPEGVIEKTPDDAKILFLPNPSQPVENLFNLDQLREIAASCRDRGILFAIDEAYHFFGATSAIPLTDEFENVLVLRTFSKAFGSASLRLGYVIGSEKAIGPLASFRLAYEANAFAMHAGGVLLDHFDSHVKPSIEDTCKGRDFLRDKLIEMGFQAWAEAGNFVLADFGAEERLDKIIAALAARGIQIRGGLPKPLKSQALITCGGLETMTGFVEELGNVLKEV